MVKKSCALLNLVARFMDQCKNIVMPQERVSRHAQSKLLLSSLMLSGVIKFYLSSTLVLRRTFKGKLRLSALRVEQTLWKRDQWNHCQHPFNQRYRRSSLAVFWLKSTLLLQSHSSLLWSRWTQTFSKPWLTVLHWLCTSQPFNAVLFRLQLLYSWNLLKKEPRNNHQSGFKLILTILISGTRNSSRTDRLLFGMLIHKSWSHRAYNLSRDLFP